MMKALLKRIAFVSPVTIVCLMFATMAIWTTPLMETE